MNKINAASKQLNSCNRDDPVFTNEEGYDYILIN